MKFVFKPSNSLSRTLYLMGLPLLLISFADRFFNLNWMDDKLRLQVFILSAIIISIASVINLAVFIFQQQIANNSNKQ